MKLLTQTVLIYLLVSVLIISIATPVLYSTVYRAVQEETSEILRHRKKTIRSKLKSIESREELAVWMRISEDIDLIPWPGPDGMKDSIYTIERQLGTHNHPEPFRELRGLVKLDKLDNQLYLFRLRTSLVETNELVKSIVHSQLYLLATLLIALLAANWLLSRRIWKPFYATLHQLKSYSIARKDIPPLSHSSISEFRTLNEAIQRMMQKISSDYQSLKQFTENASHETQTPLAVITNRLEMIMQDATLTQEQLENLHTAYTAANRLSRLHQSLLLLTKIENRQFAASQSVSLHDALAEKVQWLEDWIREKQLVLQTTLSPVHVSMNPMLAQILVSNLLGNAIRHNLPNGLLCITLTDKQLQIANSGLPPQTDPMLFFERFHKAHPHSDSLGLGLAIVREICTLYGFTIQYAYASDVHTITVQL